MLKWQKPKKSQKEIRLSEIGKELDYIEMQIQNPTLLRPVLSSTPFNVSQSLVSQQRMTQQDV